MRGPILIVDDSGTVADLLKAALERLGVEDIHWAATAKDGMRSFHKLEPTVVFLDIQLPDGDGDKLAAQMFAVRRDVKIIIITGMMRHDKRVLDAVSLGAYDVIEKPLRVDRLRQLIALMDAESKNLRRVL